MIFESKELVLSQDSREYRISMCFNGEFYQARIIHPPTPIWNEIGIGYSEADAIGVLMSKLQRTQAA